MRQLQDDIETLRRFMKKLYREVPAMRGQLQMIAVTPNGPIFIHADKRAARDFARVSQHVFQSADNQALWQRTIDECAKFNTSLYNPYFDAFFINLGHSQANGNIDLDFVLRHELGHALDDLDMDDYGRRRQFYETTADTFATLHHLRDQPDHLAPIATIANMRHMDSHGHKRHAFNTVAGIVDAVAYAKAHDITTMPLQEMIKVARDISAAVCPPPLVYNRDARGRFMPKA